MWLMSIGCREIKEQRRSHYRFLSVDVAELLLLLRDKKIDALIGEGCEVSLPLFLRCELFFGSKLASKE